jgi:DNA invertase Pin-like site-specific DNA recombinase
VIINQLRIGWPGSASVAGHLPLEPSSAFWYLSSTSPDYRIDHALLALPHLGPARGRIRRDPHIDNCANDAAGRCFHGPVSQFETCETLLDRSLFNGLSVSLMSHAKKHAKRLVGYGRISTTGQDLARQRQALKAYGCKLIFGDRASGKSLAGRPELARALDELRPGDCLVLAEWDRATRSMWDGLRIVKQVLDAGATIKVLDFPSLDLATREGRGFLAMFLAMAERERTRIVERTREGRRIAMGNGMKMGPPFKLTEHQRNLAARRMASGESTRQIARDFNVSHNTIARLR